MTSSLAFNALPHLRETECCVERWTRFYFVVSSSHTLPLPSPHLGHLVVDLLKLGLAVLVVLPYAHVPPLKLLELRVSGLKLSVAPLVG